MPVIHIQFCFARIFQLGKFVVRSFVRMVFNGFIFYLKYACDLILLDCLGLQMNAIIFKMKRTKENDRRLYFNDIQMKFTFISSHYIFFFKSNFIYEFCWKWRETMERTILKVKNNKFIIKQNKTNNNKQIIYLFQMIARFFFFNCKCVRYAN